MYRKPMKTANLFYSFKPDIQYVTTSRLGPSMKDVHTKSRKIDLPTPLSALAQLPFVRADTP